MTKYSTRFFKLISTLFAIVTVLFGGCRPLHNYQRPASIQLPLSYANFSDSTIASIGSWSQFFQDGNLKDLIDTALKNNWDNKLTLQRIQIANADFKATRAALAPAVSGVASISGDRYSKTIFNPPSTNSSLGSDIFLGLQSSWEIDIWNSLKNKRKSAYLRYLSSEEGLLMVHTNLIASVGRGYYTLLALDSTVAIAQRNIKLQKEALDILTIQKEGGRATELAIQQSRAQLLNTQALELEYRQQITETENELNKLTGRLTGTIVRNQKMPDGLLKTFAAGIPAALLLRRPDIRKAELELQAFETDIQVARAAFMPTVSLISYGGINTANLTKVFNPQSLVLGLAGGLTAPLLNRTAIKSNYDRTISVAMESFYNYQKLINNSYIEVVNNLSRIKNLKDRYVLKLQQANTLKQAVEVSRDLYLAGYATYLEVIIAQANALQSELELVSVKNKLYQSQIDLYRTLGGGWS